MSDQIPPYPPPWRPVDYGTQKSWRTGWRGAVRLLAITVGVLAGIALLGIGVFFGTCAYLTRR